MTDLYTVPEVAARFRVAKSTAYGWVGEGILPSIRVGGCVRVPAEALERWIEERTDGGQAGVGLGQPVSAGGRSVDRPRGTAKAARPAPKEEVRVRDDRGRGAAEAARPVIRTYEVAEADRPHHRRRVAGKVAP